MDVYESARSAFLDQVRIENIRLTEDELSLIQTTYNFPALQKYVDDDVAAVKSRAVYYERDRVAKERELYHQQNIQNIARMIVKRVALEKRERPWQIITESKSKEFRGFVKTAGARGCDVYPCER